MWKEHSGVKNQIVTWGTKVWRGLPNKEVDYSLRQNESEGHSLEHWHIAQITIKQELMALKWNV